MRKYWTVFKVSFQQEFAYKLNFIMWRVRNIFQIFLIFFLWDSVFTNPATVVFGYDRAKILTYVLGLVIVRAIVSSARVIDISGEISRGELGNYLVRPVSYFKYWFTRDIASKALNLIFAFFEITILFLLLHPPFFIQTDALYLLLTFVSLAVSVFLYFVLLFIFNLLTLWQPDQAWGINFLLFIFVDFMGGGIFPLDILPSVIQKILYATPFPYLIFAPLEIYLGKFDLPTAIRAIAVSAIWLTAGIISLRKMWALGLKNYASEGR